MGRNDYLLYGATTLITTLISRIGLKILPVLSGFEIIDNVVTIVKTVPGGDLKVLLLPHVLPENGGGSKGLFTVETLKVIELGLENGKVIGHIDQVIREANVKVMNGEHVTEKGGTGVGEVFAKETLCLHISPSLPFLFLDCKDPFLHERREGEEEGEGVRKRETIRKKEE